VPRNRLPGCWRRRASFALIALLASAPLRAQTDEPGSPRASAPLTILQLNDVYSTVPVDGVGGLARVATIKQRLIADGRTPLMMIAGDFLSSSVASTVFKGEQMVAALNAAGLDLATLGNHEFDFGIDVLLQRMREAKWQWVVSNVLDRETGKPIGGAAPYVVKTYGPLKVGIIGLCLASEGLGRDKLERVRLIDPHQAAAQYLPALKSAGVDVIIALTHLTFAEDRALAEAFPEIDVIVGGHEHHVITAFENRTLITKSGSDARFVGRIDVNKRSTSTRETGGIIERFHELIPVTAAIPDEPTTAAVVESYEKRLGKELEATIARTRVPLDGVAVRMRAAETNLGNLVADAMREDAEADIAIVNAGGIRGNRVHPPGPIARRTLVEIHPFGNVVTTLAVPGRVVLDALNFGVSRLPFAAGQFPQVSGLVMRVDLRAPPEHRVSEVTVSGEPLDPDRLYRLAIPDFLLHGGDGYTMFDGQKVLVGPESGTQMVLALERYVVKRDEIEPAVDGRITIQK
jgi:5'-nucleotidase